MRHLAPYLKKYRKQCILAPLFKMLEAGFDLLVPLVVAGIIDIGIANADRRAVWLRVALLLAMAVMGLLCSFTAQYFAATAAVGTSAGLRSSLLRTIQAQRISDLDIMGTEKLITRMTSDVNQVQNGINMFLRLFLRSPFIVFGAMVLAFTIHKGLAWIFVAVIAVLFVIVFGIMAITKPLYRQQNRQLEDVTGATREELNGTRVIRAFGTEQQQRARFQGLIDGLNSLQLRAGRLAAYMNPLTYLIINAGIIAIVWLGGKQVHYGTLQTGDIIALINYLSQILVELVKLANLVVLLGKAVVSMDRVGQVLDQKPDSEYSGTVTHGEDPEILRFEHVDLRYPGAGADSLTDISFSLKEGQTLAIIGGTGSGKSSLVNMIPRLYSPTGGNIYLKGEPLGSWDGSALRKTVSIVLQKPILFSGTVRSNLLWGNADATEQMLWQALEIAQADRFVKEKPDGLDAVVEQGGRNLSGGQKQRLTIARALVADADILILDDSTSALDYATEQALRQSLQKLNKTLVIVSQRTASIAHADTILVLEDGMVVGCGTHRDLLENCPVYEQIHRLQFPEGGAV